MKIKKQVPARPDLSSVPGAAARFLGALTPENLQAFLLGLTLFLVPLFPDEKLNRLKLMAFGTGLIVTGTVWALTKLFSRSWTLYRTPLDLYLGIYFVSAFLYYNHSANPAVASSEFQRMIFSVGAFFVTIQVCSGPRAGRLRKIAIAGWIAGLFLISVYGIMQKSGGLGPVMVPQMERVFGTFGNPIFFAAFLIISIPVALAWLIESGKLRWRALLLCPLLASIWALFYTGTRAAFLALPIAMALFYVLNETRNGWRWSMTLWHYRIRTALILASVIVIHLVLNFSHTGYQGNVGRVKQAIVASRITATSQTHTVIWKDVLKMWIAHPWFGTGYGTFHIEFPQYASDELKQIYPQSQRIVNDAHNEYLQILAETGLVGLAVFFSMVFVFYLTALRAFYRPGVERPEGLFQDRILYAGLLTGVTALLIQNIFSVDMRFIVSSIYVFFTMGLILSFYTGEIRVSWPTGWKSRVIKSAWLAFFLLLSGLIGFERDPKGFFIAGIYQFGKGDDGSWSWKKTAALGPGLLPALLRPYMAQKVLASTPGFFDEKLLDSAQTIKDLEQLTRQHPEQWKYWEKLGYALAREIKRTEPDGRKVVDSQIAKRAVYAYLQAHEIEPRTDGPPNNIGNIYFTMNMRDEAMKWWKKAIQTNPDKIDARLNLGLAYYYRGRIKESATQFEEVLKRDPKNKKAIVMLKRMVE